MRRKKAKETIWDIFVIKSQISDEVMVWKTESGNCYNAYKNHVHGKNEQSKDLFERSEKAGVFPKMYRIATCEGTFRVGFRYCVAWTKYFLEQGFTSVSYKSLTRYANDLMEDTQEIYDQIKDRPIDEVLTTANCIVETYNRRGRKPTEKKDAITIYLRPGEYEKIEKQANQLRLPLSKYCRNMALYGQVVKVEPTNLWEHTQKVDAARNLLKMLLYAYYQNGKYYPADLENIQKAVDEIRQAESEVTEAFCKHTKQMRKLLPK